MSEEINNNDNNNNNNNKNDDQLAQAIKEEKQKEVSYIMEASQIDDKRSKYLAKKNEYKVLFDDGSIETFKRKPLSVRKNKEIDDLRSVFLTTMRDVENKTQKIRVGDQEFDNVNDVLFEAFKRTASYCLGIDNDSYEVAIWEDDPEYMKQDVYGLRSILAACLLRAVHGVAYFPQP